MQRSDNPIQPGDLQPFRIGRRFIVVPGQQEIALAPGLIPLRVDSGRVFGSGTHPTTQLCLAALERHLQPQAAVVDLGTGTGILAIAAALLGASSVLALDTDAEAVRVARKNISTNQVAERVRVEEGSLAEVLAGHLGMTAAPLVVVNILVGVIRTLFAQGLTAAVTPGGLLILSGLLQIQTPEIRATLRQHGFQQVAQEQKEEWVCIIARGS